MSTQGVNESGSTVHDLHAGATEVVVSDGPDAAGAAGVAEIRQLTVEAWKQTIAVQMHFNDIEMRIRNFAITVIAALFAATAIAIEQKLFISLFGSERSGGVLIMIGALAAVANFFLMDRYWYHPLLVGAVKEAARLENELVRLGINVSLTRTISEMSPVPLRVWKIGTDKRKIHSRHKIWIFYGLLSITVAVLLVYVFIAVRP